MDGICVYSGRVICGWVELVIVNLAAQGVSPRTARLSKWIEHWSVLYAFENGDMIVCLIDNCFNTKSLNSLYSNEYISFKYIFYFHLLEYSIKIIKSPSILKRQQTVLMIYPSSIVCKTKLLLFRRKECGFYFWK